MNDRILNCNKCGVLFDLYSEDSPTCIECVRADPIWAVLQERNYYKRLAEAAEKAVRHLNGICEKFAPDLIKDEIISDWQSTIRAMEEKK